MTGRRRRAGWLDCVMLRQAVRLNSLSELALTKLDVLDGFDQVKVCTGYEIDAGRVNAFPDRSDVLARAIPMYQVVPGWSQSLGDVRSPDDLPEGARGLLHLVQQQVGVRVGVVGVGAERDDYLHWTASP